MNNISSAVDLAQQFHAGQFRKGTSIPYISHPLAAAAIVLESGGSEAEVIAALLHDAIEDGGGELARQKIQELFGPEVTAIVDGCTDTDVTPKPPWRDRKLAYIDHLKTAPRSVLLVSAADKLHNLISINNDFRLCGDELWGRFNITKMDHLWYQNAMFEIFRERGLPSALLLRLERELLDLKKHVLGEAQP